MAKTVNVVVTCTKRKTIAVPADLHLRKTRAPTLEQRAAKWTERLQGSVAPSVPAEDLYAGDQWQISKALPDVGAEAGLQVNLWVCSAGYGLIHSATPIRPYSATFSSTHPDSVRTSNSRLEPKVLTEWWKLLQEWKGPQPKQCRSIASIAREYQRSPLLIVVSSVYLGAICDDIKRAVDELSDTNLLTIISGGLVRAGDLTPNLLPCDGRFQKLLGGALMSLNVRVARRILQNANHVPLNVEELTKAYRLLLRRQPEMQVYDRQAMTDRDVSRYISLRLRETPQLKASPMLRALRDSGFACEQKRFGRIFNQVWERQNAR